MPFYTDSIALSYTDIQGAKQWWINTFDCKLAKVPSDWDNALPSDVALKLPHDDAPTILLSARAEEEQAGFDRPPPVVSVIFCDKLNKSARTIFNSWSSCRSDPRWRRHSALRDSRHRS